MVLQICPLVLIIAFLVHSALNAGVQSQKLASLRFSSLHLGQPHALKEDMDVVAEYVKRLIHSDKARAVSLFIRSEQDI